MRLNKCKNCDFCKTIYRCRIIQSKRKLYYCTKFDKIIKLGDSCNNYLQKIEKTDLSDERFEEVINQLKCLINHYSK